MAKFSSPDFMLGILIACTNTNTNTCCSAEELNFFRAVGTGGWGKGAIASPPLQKVWAEIKSKPVPLIYRLFHLHPPLSFLDLPMALLVCSHVKFMHITSTEEKLVAACTQSQRMSMPILTQQREKKITSES